MTPCGCHETFWTLLRDPAHWLFELLLILIFDVIIGALIWPFAKKHIEHHLARDKEEGMHGTGN